MPRERWPPPSERPALRLPLRNRIAQEPERNLVGLRLQLADGEIVQQPLSLTATDVARAPALAETKAAISLRSPALSALALSHFVCVCFDVGPLHTVTAVLYCDRNLVAKLVSGMRFSVMSSSGRVLRLSVPRGYVRWHCDIHSHAILAN